MKEKVIPHRWAKDRKGMGTNSGKSGMRNLGRHLVKKKNGIVIFANKALKGLP